MSLEYDMVELQRRVANMVMFGTVLEVDADLGAARVQIGKLETAALPWLSTRMGNRKDWAAPAVDEQVMVVCHNGDPAQGIIVASLGSTKNPRPSKNPRLFKTVFADGSFMQMDLDTKEMKVACAGPISVSAAGDVNVVTQTKLKATAAQSAEVAAPIIKLMGDVAITGALSVEGATTLKTTTVDGVPLKSPNTLF